MRITATLQDLGNILDFVMPNSKSLVKAGWTGEIDEFCKRLCEQNWSGTWDYTMAIIVLAIVVASSKANNVMVDARSRDDKLKKTADKKHESILLSEYINQKVSKDKVEKLFERIVNIAEFGDANRIASCISESGSARDKWFGKCFKALVSHHDETKTEKVYGDFLKRVKKMKPWRSAGINYRCMRELCKVMNNAFRTKLEFDKKSQEAPASISEASFSSSAHTGEKATATTTATQSKPMKVQELTEEETVNEELKKQWQENRYNSEAKSKIGFEEMVAKANEEHARLKKMGIFSEGDNSRNPRSGGQFSTNFIKLFIRYIQRAFSNLDGYVKIYYYPNMEEKPLDNYVLWRKEMSEEEFKKTDDAIQKRNEERKNQYWNLVKKLVSESKKEGTICLIFNQVVFKDTPQEGGHANLTVICGGEYRIFETVQDCAFNTVGYKDYNGDYIKVMPGTIQSDPQNCVSIIFGYMESLMKQMSAWIEEKNYKSDKKQFSEYVWNQISGYSKVKISDDIQGTDHRSLQALLPPKYIRYIQTSQGRNKLINLPKTADFERLEETDRQKIREVAEELSKVAAKYDLSKKLLEPFLKDVATNDECLEQHLKPGVIKIAKAIGKDLSTILWGDLKELMSKKRLSYKCNYMKYIVWQKSTGEKIEVDASGWWNEPLVDLFDGKCSAERADVENELKTNPIYKVVCDNPPEMSINKLSYAENTFFDYMQDIVRMNDPAQMRRRRNLLKVATLVDVLDKHRKSTEPIQTKVREEVGKVEELLASP